MLSLHKKMNAFHRKQRYYIKNLIENPGIKQKKKKKMKQIAKPLNSFFIYFFFPKYIFPL